MAPITSDDVKLTLAGMKDGAPGPDGRRLKDLKNIPIQELVAHYNLWLLAGYQPEALRRGETVLLPKEPGTKKPEKHRPITMSDLVIRCFHRILAKRMENLLPFNSRKKAFMAADGVAESVCFLSSVINQHKADLQPVNIAFVDVTKAFDPVSHHSLLITAERLGFPPPFLTYVNSLYRGAQTVLRICPERSSSIKVGCGVVRQGDPLSPHLFNAVIDWAIDGRDPELGVLVGNRRVNCGAFADDITLIARSPAGLQCLFDDLSEEFRLSGLELSAGLTGKSACLRIDVDGKAKRWIANPNPFLRQKGKPGDARLIPSISIDEVQNYLKVPFSPVGARADVATKHKDGLSDLSSVPLKPQQRMYCLNHHLIPVFYH